MIAGQLTRVQIGEIAVSRWWSFPYSRAWPPRTIIVRPFGGSPLPLVSLFRFGGNTGQHSPHLGVSSPLLAGGSPLGEKGGIRKKEGVDVHAICLLVSPDSIPPWKTCSHRFLPDGATAFLGTLSYEPANPRGKSECAPLSRVQLLSMRCFPFLVSQI